MNVTAKAFVATKIETGEGDSRQTNVTFAADYNDGRNKEWSLYTPSLSFAMTLKGAVADQFTVGEKVTVTFTTSEDVTSPST